MTDQFPTELAGKRHDLARAKINLSLAVLGRRADGYHDLESLVAFARHGDHLSLQAAATFSFQAVGPFASALGPPEKNLVVQAVQRLAVLCRRSLNFSITLDKRLPVAAGLGGGSADAAAALRLALRYWNCSPPAQQLIQLCQELGADVPVCYKSRACWMGGVGEKIESLDFFPTCPALLVNPGVAVMTRTVFDQLGTSQNLDSRRLVRQTAFCDPQIPQYSPVLENSFPASQQRLEVLRGTQLHREKITAPPVNRPSFASYPQLIEQLRHLSNDLQAPALSLHPIIGKVLQALAQQPGVLYRAMSGSGASCFALFSSQTEAREAAHRLAQDHNWWVLATELC